LTTNQEVKKRNKKARIVNGVLEIIKLMGKEKTPALSFGSMV